MRFARVTASLIATLTVLAACGDSPASEATDTTAAEATGTTTAATVDSATDTVAAGGDTGDAAATSAPAEPATAKPEVAIPAELPTELVVTDLVEGTGPAAKAGDLVLVNYVGVRSADGTEFDNSYDRGQPFSVTLGAGMVIQGWDDGLVGIKQGGRRQLDIPADLAYGDSPQGDVIQAGDALTFVVDAVAVVALPDPSQAPTGTIAPATNVDALASTDLVVGDGPAIEPGQKVFLHLVAYRADTGEEINSSWAEGSPLEFTFGSGEVLPAIDTAIDGMQVGGRRQVTIPFAEAFGESGNEGLGLPPSTDLVLVLDLVGAF